MQVSDLFNFPLWLKSIFEAWVRAAFIQSYLRSLLLKFSFFVKAQKCFFIRTNSVTLFRSCQVLSFARESLNRLEQSAFICGMSYYNSSHKMDLIKLSRQLNSIFCWSVPNQYWARRTCKTSQKFILVRSDILFLNQMCYMSIVIETIWRSLNNNKKWPRLSQKQNSEGCLQGSNGLWWGEAHQYPYEQIKSKRV